MGIDHLDQLTQRIIHCVITVHQTLGPGFVEKIYRRALVLELRKRGLRVEIEKSVLIHYDGRKVGRHVLNLVVEDVLLLELKTVERLVKMHYSQVRSYLKATGMELGLLVNFSSEMADFRRVPHPDPRMIIRDRRNTVTDLTRPPQSEVCREMKVVACDVQRSDPHD